MHQKPHLQSDATTLYSVKGKRVGWPKYTGALGQLCFWCIIFQAILQYIAYLVSDEINYNGVLYFVNK